MQDDRVAKPDSTAAASLTQRYFAGRADGLRPSSSEELLVGRCPVTAAKSR
jgi:hypothetical protein